MGAIERLLVPMKQGMGFWGFFSVFTIDIMICWLEGISGEGSLFSTEYPGRRDTICMGYNFCSSSKMMRVIFGFIVLLRNLRMETVLLAGVRLRFFPVKFRFPEC